MHDATIGTFNVQTKTIRAPGHEAVLTSIRLKASQGILRAGLVISQDKTGHGIPFESLSTALGTGNGSTKNFTGTVADAPLEPGSISVTDGVETFIDDGLGNLIGDAGGTGSAVYMSGAVTVSFDSAVANATEIELTAGSDIAGVLDRDVDTFKAADGTAVIHGTVKEGELLKGAAEAACGAAEFKLLQKRGIYPV